MDYKIEAKGIKREREETIERTIYGLNDAIEFHNRMGGYFFSPGAMRSFNSRVGSDCAFFEYNGQKAIVFYTSEKHQPLYSKPEPRLYTVRFIVLTGESAGKINEIAPMSEVSAFQYFKTGRQASALIKKIRDKKVKFSPLKAWAKEFPFPDLFAEVI